MKLRKELPEIERRFSAILANLETYAPRLAASGRYKNFITRLAWDTLRVTYTPAEICALYEKYNCNDDHMTTAARAALLAVYPGAVDFVREVKQ
jgi:hypothetical protein